ncbi:hypothetical protein [Chlorobaculum parvum]|uniref:hypothetical protein n=1 Tax=Chlorobaculum parvum TaxID=274539 RepID=UPI0002F11CF2|nr:hypothetical protein [Chlorobaculum parvum]
MSKLPFVTEFVELVAELLLQVFDGFVLGVVVAEVAELFLETCQRDQIVNIE